MKKKTFAKFLKYRELQEFISEEPDFLENLRKNEIQLESLENDYQKTKTLFVTAKFSEVESKTSSLSLFFEEDLLRLKEVCNGLTETAFSLQNEIRVCKNKIAYYTKRLHKIGKQKKKLKKMEKNRDKIQNKIFEVNLSHIYKLKKFFSKTKKKTM